LICRKAPPGGPAITGASSKALSLMIVTHTLRPPEEFLHQWPNSHPIARHAAARGGREEGLWG
jgi:hypothetical protein